MHRIARSLGIHASIGGVGPVGSGGSAGGYPSGRALIVGLCVCVCFFGGGQVFSRAALGAVPGRDGVLQDVIVKAPLGINISLWQHFEALFEGKLSRAEVAPSSLDFISLAGLPKYGKTAGWDDRRWGARALAVSITDIATSWLVLVGGLARIWCIHMASREPTGPSLW